MNRQHIAGVSKIISHNTDRRVSNLIQLKQLITDHQPIACLLQDVPNRSESVLQTMFREIARGYRIIFDREYGRIYNLILVDIERVNVNKIHMYGNQSKALTLGVSISQLNPERNEIYGRIILFSIYIRPRAMYNETRDCLEWIEKIAKENEGHSRTIIMGDMNASDPTWCPIEDIMQDKESSDKHYRQIKEVRGRTIARFMDRIHLTCLNAISHGPTFIGEQREAYTDLAWVGNIVSRQWNSLTLECPGDRSAHKALVLEARGLTKQIFRRRTCRRIRPELLSSSHFEELHIRCDKLCTNWRQLPRDRIANRMDRLTNVLYDTILRAQHSITQISTRRIYRRSNCTVGGLCAKTRQRLKRLRKNEAKLLRAYARLRVTHSLNSNQVSSAQLRESINTRGLLKLRNRRLRKKIMIGLEKSSLHDNYAGLTDRDTWERVHIFERHTTEIEHTNDLSASPTVENRIKSQEDLERLADQKFPYRYREMLCYVKNAYEDSKGAIKIEVNDEEICAAVQDLRNKTYKGAGGIKMNIFYKSLEYTANIVKALIQMSFWIHYIPKRARITQGTLIPKKAPGQYRIVHVSSPLPALLELVALKRLEHRLEILQLNSPYQFGFSALVSRHDLVARIIELILKEHAGKGSKARSVLVSLDIEGAFDNVNQDKLIQLMHDELQQDPVKYWLAEFMLNRKISVKKGTFESELRNICMGVPQGSALGPVLWNYMIHNLDGGLAIPGMAELLRYADDIFLIYNGNSRSDLQDMLNDLATRLEIIDLNIRPEKCSLMSIKLSGTDRKQNDYYINGKRIKNVKSMNVLGVPITDKLKLDKTSCEHRDKYFKSVKRLLRINRLGLINTAKEWRTLVESYLKSRLVINNWPILLVDTQSCDWIDARMINALRMIYGWPKNTSTKLIRLITGTLECGILVRRIAEHRALTEFRPIYEFLLKVSRHGGRTTARQKREGVSEELNLAIIDLGRSITRHRKHHNPTKPLQVTEQESIIRGTEESRPTWIMLDRRMGSMIAEVQGNQVIQTKIGRHEHYPISYFNSFALLLRTVHDKSIINRCLTLSDTNSILSALENIKNRDWRVIQLREAMFDNGWKIVKIPLGEERRLRSALAQYYRNMNLVHDRNVNDFLVWLWHNERPTDSEPDEQQQPSHRVETIREPYLYDYKRRNFLNMTASLDDHTYYMRMHTSITHELARDEAVWQNITPGWLSGPKMLVLQGIVRDTNGELVYGGEGSNLACGLCEQIDPAIEENYAISNRWHGIREGVLRKHMVLHRSFECRAFIKERKEFIEYLGINGDPTTDGRKAIEGIITDRMRCQKLLTFMARCSLHGE